MDTNSITTTHPKICEFYRSHPHISFDAMNLILIDILDKTTLQIIPPIKDDCQINNTLTQLSDIKNDYITEISGLIETNGLSNVDAKHNELMDEIRTVLSSFPAMMDSGLEKSMASFSMSISQDTCKLLTDINQSSIKDFVQNYDMKLTMFMQNIQQSIYAFLSSSEERITNNIKHAFASDVESQQSFLRDLKLIVDSNSRSVSPTFHDNKILSSVLTKLFPSADILMPSSLNDDELIIKRLRKTNIFVKNHIFDTNVLSDDIGLFLQTVDDNNCNGILLSQQSGVSSKKNYQIDMHNNRIIVYVHDVQYNPAKIQIAVDIIDNLSTKLSNQKIRGEDDLHITKDVLDNINNEYQLFISQKTAVADVMKEQQKKVLAQIDELKFPVLDKLLSTKYLAPIPKPGLKCELCKNYFANNLKALAAHKRGCIRKNPSQSNKENCGNIQTLSRN
jgi:hypothetical protein